MSVEESHTDTLKYPELNQQDLQSLSLRLFFRLGRVEGTRQ